MNSKFLIIPVFLIGALFLGQIPDSFGHGLGSETMPPVMIGDLEAYTGSKLINNLHRY